MDVTLVVLAANAAAAGFLCLVAWLASHVVRRPSIVHALWALALLKLVTPPLLPVPLLPLAPLASGAPAAPAAGPTAMGLGVGTASVPVGSVAGALVGTSATTERPPLERAVELTLAVGALVVGALAFTRARRFRRLLRRGQPVPAEVASRVETLAARLGLRRAPQTLLVDARIPPLLWPGRSGPLLVLPERLLPELSDEELDALLVHELAHVRRRDHWLRIVEILATALFWWYPVAWWLRRSLRKVEERCCDEWVLRLLPGAATTHARGLLKTVAFTSAGTPPLPATASAAVRAADLEDRLTALLTLPPHAPFGRGTRVTLAVLAAVALLAFPVSCRQESFGVLSADLLVLQGAPGDPLVKYVGLPVKVLPEATFRTQLDEARRRTAERAQPVVPEARRRQAEAEVAVAATWEDVNRTRATWLALPAGSPRRIVAEQAYVKAMRRKDEETRRAGELALETLGVVTAAKARGFAEIEFQGLSGAVAVTRTDSDGRFTVRLPRSGRYVIAIAAPTRHHWSPLGTMSYYWQASLDGWPAKRLTLRGETGVEGQAPYLVAYRPPR